MGSAGISAGISAAVAIAIATNGVCTGTGAYTTLPAWFGSNHAPCLAFKPLFTDYY
jgi:hypothetical protein